jgi:hypothetical protein
VLLSEWPFPAFHCPQERFLAARWRNLTVRGFIDGANGMFCAGRSSGSPASNKPTVLGH